MCLGAFRRLQWNRDISAVKCSFYRCETASYISGISPYAKCHPIETTIWYPWNHSYQMCSVHHTVSKCVTPGEPGYLYMCEPSVCNTSTPIPCPIIITIISENDKKKRGFNLSCSFGKRRLWFCLLKMVPYFASCQSNLYHSTSPSEFIIRTICASHFHLFDITQDWFIFLMSFSANFCSISMHW